MSQVTQWWWIRHAPVADYDGRIYGATDRPADTSDAAAFAALAAALPEGAVWVTSHLSRTIDTAAAIVAAGLEAPPPMIEEELGEQSFGDWHGVHWDEVRAAGEPEYRKFWADPGNVAPPGGESVAELMVRARRAIERLCATHAGRDIVAVTHGGTIRAAMALALGLGAEQALSLRIDNLSLTRLDHVSDGIIAGGGGGRVWRVVSFNENLIPGRRVVAVGGANSQVAATNPTTGASSRLAATNPTTGANRQ